MIHLLAQTGMANWSVAEWTMFIASVSALAASIFAGIKSLRANDKATDAQATAKSAHDTANDANKTAAEAKGASDVNTTRMTNVANRQYDIALATPTPAQQSQPPAPSTEQIRAGLDAANKPE